MTALPSDKLKQLILLFLAAMMAPAQRFIGGDVSASELPGLWLPIIADYHARAGVLGRSAAGDTAPTDDDDRTFGEQQAASDAPYLQRYAGELATASGEADATTGGGAVDASATENPRAAGTASDAGVPNAAAMKKRLRLYAERLHATAHEAYVMAMPPSTKYHWRLGSHDPCPDCVDLASGSPYTADTLPSYPGDGSTQCLTMCKCWLETVEKAEAPFKP